MFIILKNRGNIFVHVRRSLKIIFLAIISAVLIIGLISLVYKPSYSVTINGEFVGYAENKTNLQTRINEYIENKGENVAFVDIKDLPQYSLCLLKRDTETNDDEIYEKVVNSGTTYYGYYAIVESDEEKYYVATKEEAEAIIDELKTKKSSNINKIAYTQVHSTETKELTDKDTVVSALYKKAVVVASASYSTYSGEKIISTETPSSEVLGIGLIRPVSGLITSRYGARWGSTHKGIDIATSTGTPFAAAAAGTVIYSAYDSYGLGNCIKIDHGNGVVTVYGHASALYVTVGQYVSQGEVIGAVGSTGNSTGPHLHLEIRLDGVAQNPQLYLYN